MRAQLAVSTRKKDAESSVEEEGEASAYADAAPYRDEGKRQEREAAADHALAATGAVLYRRSAPRPARSAGARGARGEKKSQL